MDSSLGDGDKGGRGGKGIVRGEICTGSRNGGSRGGRGEGMDQILGDEINKKPWDDQHNTHCLGEADIISDDVFQNESSQTAKNNLEQILNRDPRVKSTVGKGYIDKFCENRKLTSQGPSMSEMAIEARLISPDSQHTRTLLGNSSSNEPSGPLITNSPKRSTISALGSSNSRKRSISALRSSAAGHNKARQNTVVRRCEAALSNAPGS